MRHRSRSLEVAFGWGLGVDNLGVDGSLDFGVVPLDDLRRW